MRFTDCSFAYLGEHDLIGTIERGALVANEAEDGHRLVTLMYMDDGLLRDENGSLVKRDGRFVQDRMSRLRPYDTLVEATITQSDDGSWKVSGISTAAKAHPAFGPDEDRVDLKVVPGPNCRDCGRG